MIKALRIDDRLMHAQVTFGWANSLGVKGILIISDQAAADPNIKMAAQFAKPSGMNLWIKNEAEGISALAKLNGFSYNTMVLTDTVSSALRICQQSDCIHYVNLGGQRAQAGKKPILGTVFVSDQDLEDLKKIEALNIQVEVKKMITDPGYPLTHFL